MFSLSAVLNQNHSFDTGLCVCTVRMLASKRRSDTYYNVQMLIRLFRNVVRVVLGLGGVIGAVLWILTAVRLIFAWWQSWTYVIAELSALKHEIMMNCGVPDVRLTAGMREHCNTWKLRREFMLKEDPVWRALGMAVRDVGLCGSDGCIKDMGDYTMSFISYAIFVSIVLFLMLVAIIFISQKMHKIELKREQNQLCLPHERVTR